MKSEFLKSSLILIVVAGTVFALHSQPTAQPPDKKVYDTDGSDGRYRLIVANDTYGSREYVIDTQSGRVWHSTLDAQKKMAVLASETYENINGDLSTIPNETVTRVVFTPKSTTSPP